MEVCQSPAQLKQGLQMDRLWSLHASLPHLQQVLTICLFSVQNSHCLMPFGLRIGEGPAAAPCALVTKSAEADERGRRPRFNMCGFTNISPTSSTYSHLLCVFLCFQDGSLVSTARRHCIVRCPAGCGRGPLASDLFSSCRNRCQEPNKKNKT